jgi:hypothetical protein
LSRENLLLSGDFAAMADLGVVAILHAVPGVAVVVREPDIISGSSYVVMASLDTAWER